MLKKHIVKLFGSIIEKEKQMAVNSALFRYQEAEAKRRQENANAELEYLVGKPVIGISNEWGEPIIGTLVRLELIGTTIPSALPVIFDELTQQEYLFFGTVCHYSVELVRALEKLTPSEAWVLVTKGRCGAFVPPEGVEVSHMSRPILSRLPTNFGEDKHV